MVLRELICHSKPIVLHNIGAQLRPSLLSEPQDDLFHQRLSSRRGHPNGRQLDRYDIPPAELPVVTRAFAGLSTAIVDSLSARAPRRGPDPARSRGVGCIGQSGHH